MDIIDYIRNNREPMFLDLEEELDLLVKRLYNADYGTYVRSSKPYLDHPYKNIEWIEDTPATILLLYDKDGEKPKEMYIPAEVFPELVQRYRWRLMSLGVKLPPEHFSVTMNKEKQ